MTFNLPGALAFEKKTLHYEIDQVQNFLTQSWPKYVQSSRYNSLPLHPILMLKRQLIFKDNQH